jgi:hypothetical protein
MVRVLAFPTNAKATVAEIGITRKEIHDARLVRDAEVVDHGVVRRTVEEDLADRKEPTKAKCEACPGRHGCHAHSTPLTRNPLLLARVRNLVTKLAR